MILGKPFSKKSVFQIFPGNFSIGSDHRDKFLISSNLASWERIKRSKPEIFSKFFMKASLKKGSIPYLVNRN